MRQTVNGIALGYEVQGEGQAVVCLHAFPLTRRMWARQVAALRATHRVVTVDVRGFGESELAAPYSLDDVAGDVLALSRALGVGRAAVVGLSMGGYVAFRLIERAPGFATALVLADTRAEPDAPEARAQRLALADRVQREGMAAMADFLAGLVGPTSKASRPEVSAEVSALIGAPEPAAVAAALRALGGRPDSRPLLGRIAAPTLVLVGEEDALTPVDSARVMAEGIPGARLTVLPGAGHLSNLEVPEAFNRELVGFLGGAAR